MVISGDLNNKHASFYWDFMGLFMGISWDFPASIWENHGIVHGIFMEYSEILPEYERVLGSITAQIDSPN